MTQRCFEACSVEYEVDSADEARWDQGTRLRPNQNDQRALCSCGRPLRRQARLPAWAVLLACGSNEDCDRCSETILPGDMHFVCADCDDTRICKDCGPGVYIERSYDYFNGITGERRVQHVPSTALHERPERRRLRGVALEAAETPVEALAAQVVRAASKLSEQVSKEQDILDSKWNDSGVLLSLLGADGLESAVARALHLIQATQAILSSQPTLTEATVPCKVYGDLHGQFRDLLMLCHTFGMPGAVGSTPSTVFNGDFVDRGRHQLEVLMVLFSFKVLYPDNVFLNRGNHEDKSMNARYGFEAACTSAFGSKHGDAVFQAASDAFMHLPLGCLIGGKVLAVHGGIGDGKWSINDLREVRRPLSHHDLVEPFNQWLWNILWSDPIEDDSDNARAVFGVHNSPRSKAAVKFGWNVTQAFCAKNALDLVVRSHQSKKGSLGFDVMHNESLIRVFSARDYENNHNDGAVLMISKDDNGVLSVRSQVLASLSHDSSIG